jgi:hypothetical protein
MYSDADWATTTQLNPGAWAQRQGEEQLRLVYRSKADLDVFRVGPDLYDGNGRPLEEGRPLIVRVLLLKPSQARTARLRSQPRRCR